MPPRRASCAESAYGRTLFSVVGELSSLPLPRHFMQGHRHVEVSLTPGTHSHPARMTRATQAQQLTQRTQPQQRSSPSHPHPSNRHSTATSSASSTSSPSHHSQPHPHPHHLPHQALCPLHLPAQRQDEAGRRIELRARRQRQW